MADRDATANDPPTGPAGRPPRLAAAGTGARVWLVRHPEVAAEWRERAYGDLDVPLCDEGLAECDALARSFASEPLRAVLASPLERARRLGAAVAAACGLPLDVRPELRELHRGRWQGKTRAELEREHADEAVAYYADPWTYDAHGGESDAAICARARVALDAATRAAQGEAALVATHYNVIRVLVARAIGIAPARSFALRVDPGCAALLVDGEHGWVLGHLNVRDPRAALPEGEIVSAGRGPRHAPGDEARR